MANDAGGWAVAYRVKTTQEGQFHDDAHDVDQTTARKVFGQCIRAAELGMKVEGVEIDAVRLLKVGARADDGDAVDWDVVLQHDTDWVLKWKAWREESGKAAPYHDETMPLGVPCLPGAWGGDGCAMHSGFPHDENGLCIEGRRAVKVLDLIVVPKAMQERWGLPATMTREEVEQVQACAVAVLVERGQDEKVTDEQLARAVEVLERGERASR